MTAFQIYIMSSRSRSSRSSQQEVQLFEMIVNLANSVHCYLAIQVDHDEVLDMNIEVDMEEDMEIDDNGDGESMPRTLPLSRTWDFMELDEISGDGVLIQYLMEEDRDARYDDDLDKYLVTIEQIMEADAEESFNYWTNF